MINKIKNSILMGLVIGLFSQVVAFAQTYEKLNADILNTHNTNEIIYIIDENGKLIRLNNGMNDIVPENFVEGLSYIDVNSDGYVLLDNQNKMSSSYDVKNKEDVAKIDGNFFLTKDGKVSSFISKYAKILNDFKNVKDIKALSKDVVMIYEQDGTVSVVCNGDNNISVVKKLTNVLDAVVFKDEFILVLKNDGKVIGWGEGFDLIKSKVDSISNGKKFIYEGDNLYVITSDNKAIPIVENGFIAPAEYLSNVSDITINKFSNTGGDLYKAYFVTPEGNVSYYIQSDNQISDFNKEKMEYINSFTNVEKVYESGYLTIVLHKDGSITIPFNIHHELNGITGVKNILLKNQSYVVYLEDGQVITSLENFILNKKEIPTYETNDLYEYLNRISLMILNKEFDIEKFNSIKSDILSDKEKFKEIIKQICLDRKFLMLDMPYKQLIDILYSAILNIEPNYDEYNHIDYVIINKTENRSKKYILSDILDYIFENPIFSNTFDNLKEI